MRVVETRKSEMYTTLAWMGLLSTEERRIRAIRENNDNAYERLDLNYDDIERVGYYYPHVELNPKRRGLVEMWIEDHYLNPERLTFIETTNCLYAILDGKYDELIPVRCFYNPSIIQRYSKVVDDDKDHVHTVIIDTSDQRYANIPHIEHAAYYISEDRVCIPEATWLDNNKLRFRAPYRKDIDFFICGNLVNVVQVHAGKGVYLDNPQSNYCYHEITVDHSSTYPIDARFYPCVTVDKDCILRVYNDNYHKLLFPDVSRLVLYPEFIDVEDPYNTDNEYLKNLPFVDDIITTEDDDQTILDKFSRIVASSFRLWQRYPTDSTEQSDFVICDNAKLRERAFRVAEVNLTDASGPMICSMVPYEPFRDILFYEGTVFTDYITRPLRMTKDGGFRENQTGMECYLIPATYDADKFTLVKFNTAEDTTIMNIGEYINEENIARLHFKLNRFYRNLMVLRTSFMDDADDYVRVMTTEPTTKDSILWFELLINAVPEMFESNPIDTINLFGLDPDKIPEDIKTGAYMLELDPKDGPTNYTQLMMTYYKLTKAQKDYLVLQAGEGIDDPRIQVFHEIKVGRLGEAPEVNEMVVEDDTDPTYTEKEVEHGYKDHPEDKDGPHTPGDLYAQVDDTDIIPPGADNIHIDKISMGPNTPEPDEKTLWIDAPRQLPAPDEYDGVTDKVSVVNDADKIPYPKKSDYAMESMDGSIPPDQEGESHFEELLDGLSVPAEPDEPDDDQFGDLLDGLTDVVGSNKTVSEIEAPQIGEYALDDISLYNEDLGRVITMSEIEAIPNDTKYAIVLRLITDDNEPADPSIGDLWVKYLSAANTELLNTIVFKLLLAKDVCHLDVIEDGTLALEGDNLPETEETLAYGDHPEYVRPSEMLIESVARDKLGNPVPNYDVVKRDALTYIMSVREPDDVKHGDIWFNMPASTFKEVIKDILSSILSEIGKDLPEGYFSEGDYDTLASMGIDYFAHDHGTEGVGELFREKSDETLRRIFYGSEPDRAMLKEDDIWYEFLDGINHRVAYSDPNTMVVRMDERLLLLQFEHNNVQAFAFDDILVNFRGKLGVKYLSIIADLLNSGEITQDQVNIFYHRLVTFGDDIELDLRRLYTNQSNIVVTNKLDTTDLSVMYSTNIGRFRMDYSSPEMCDREREAAYRMIIDYSRRDFAFLDRRMLLFVNGKYIPTTGYKEDFSGKIQLLNFHEIIATVDIFYQKKDLHLMALKKKAYQYWQIPDTSTSIQRPESTYNTMKYIAEYDHTMKGYYDILLEEYIFSGKLLNILQYLEEHRDEADDFCRDLIRKFHAISDTDVSAMPFDQSRIVLYGGGTDAPYGVGIVKD